MPWTRTTSSKGRTHSLAPRPGSLVRLTFRNGAGVRGGELAVKPPASLSPDQNLERPIPVQAKLVRVAGIAPATFPLRGAPLVVGLKDGVNGTPGRTLTYNRDVRSASL